MKRAQKARLMCRLHLTTAAWVVLGLALLWAIPVADAMTLVVSTGPDAQANGDALQTAINSASCGDTIVLQAGSTYATRVSFANSYGPQGYPFKLPNKSCAKGTYVTIQTSAIGSLPSGRIAPSNIGLMATMATNSNSWIIEPAPSAGNYQFIGIEFTNTPNLTAQNGYNPVLVFANSASPTYGSWGHDMVFDRVWIHPYDDVTNPSGPTRTAQFGIILDGENQTIKNSYISGFCCYQSDTPSVFAQSEAIAVVGYGPGPITITNNFIEAFSWNIFTGGSTALPNPANQATITSATLTQARFSQTATLQVGDYVAINVPRYTNSAGVDTLAYVVVVDSINGTLVTYHGEGPDAIRSPLPADGSTASWRGVRINGMTVTYNTLSKRPEWCAQYGRAKSVWEMKDGSNVLFEGNRVQIPPGCAPINPAFATNQDGTAPWTATNNNTFRNNLFLGLGRMVVVQGYRYHTSVPPTGTLTVTNNLFDGSPRESFMETQVAGGNAGSNWVVTHNTVRGITNSIFHDISDGTAPAPNVTFRDNIVTSGLYMFNPNSAYPNKIQDHNVVINNSDASAPSYMSADFVVSSDSAVGFVNVGGADAGGDYHGYALSPSSPFKGRASDGTDPGVNFTLLDAALGGADGGSSPPGGGGLAAPANLTVQ